MRYVRLFINLALWCLYQYNEAIHQTNNTIHHKQYNTHNKKKRFQWWFSTWDYLACFYSKLQCHWGYHSIMRRSLSYWLYCIVLYCYIWIHCAVHVHHSRITIQTPLKKHLKPSLWPDSLQKLGGDTFFALDSIWGFWIRAFLFSNVMDQWSYMARQYFNLIVSCQQYNSTTNQSINRPSWGINILA
jgi:hypothetical protein